MSEINKNGTYVKYFKNGNIRTICNYKNNILEGFYLRNDMNGKVDMTGSFENGKRIGIWFNYDENGQIFWSKYYKSGFLVISKEYKKNNIKRILYDNKSQEITFNDNLKSRGLYKNMKFTKESDNISNDLFSLRFPYFLSLLFFILIFFI